MKLRALGVSVCLAVLGAVTPLRESFAGSPKVDLEAWLGGVPMQDDNKTFLTEGDEVTDTAIGVSPGTKQSTIISEQIHGENSSQGLEVVVHGKRLLQGTIIENNGTDEIAFVTPKPKKVVAFQMKQGKAYKFKVPSKVFFNGVKVAKGVEYGTVTFLGFEDVVTPLGTFTGAARFMRMDNIRLKSRGDVFEIRTQTESWVDADFGNVRFIQSENDFDNGFLTDSIPAQEWLFDHGVIQGVTVGPPMPAGGASASARAIAHSSGSDLLNADASVVTQEFVTSGAPVGTRASGSGGITYLPGVDYSRAGSDANAP